jgi:RimJ/RimL family protein N-acetyltransferase
MFDAIETERLIIRPYRPDEAPLLHSIIGDRRVIFWATRSFTFPEAERWLAEILAMPDGLGWWPVFRREGPHEGAHLGHVALQRLGDSEDIEIAYHFHVDAWGRGYATEAARAALDYGFRALGLERIVAIALPVNARSIRVIDKLGLEPIGTRMHHELEHREFALTRAEYLARSP